VPSRCSLREADRLQDMYGPSIVLIHPIAWKTEILHSPGPLQEGLRRPHSARKSGAGGVGCSEEANENE
jgi:hypothetical protein